MDVEVERVSLRLREPLRAAWGTVETRDLLRVTVRDASGRIGLGEAAPLPGYDPVSLEDVRAELEAGAAVSSHARAALDIADWDLRGHREGRPVAELLASDPLGAVPVNALIGAEDAAQAAAAAREAAECGHRCVKVKVGVGEDADRVRAIREAVGGEVAIRLDANGAWTVEEAVAVLDEVAPLGIELCEEPVRGLDGLREVRARVSVPVAMDETAREPSAAGSGAADAVCLHIGAAGGISGALEAADRVRAANSDVYLASTFDGPIGVAAALHVAAALQVTRPCGLATLELFEGMDNPLPVVDGAIRVPRGPGLGVGSG